MQLNLHLFTLDRFLLSPAACARLKSNYHLARQPSAITTAAGTHHGVHDGLGHGGQHLALHDGQVGGHVVRDLLQVRVRRRQVVVALLEAVGWGLHS